MRFEQIISKLSSFGHVFPDFRKGFYNHCTYVQNLMTCKIIPISLLALFCCACDYVDYSSDVHKEAIKNFQKKKYFIYVTGFEGVTNGIEYCKECDINKYSLHIRITKLSSKIAFSDLNYPPYYYFRDSLLVLTVNKKVFDLIKKGEQIKKLPKSNDIIISSERIQLLSKKNTGWLPER